MTAVDTNILVRIVTNDDPIQVRRAVAFLHGKKVFIPKTVFLEMEWVLRHAYKLERLSIVRAFHGILGLPNVTTEDQALVIQAIEWYQSGLDFGDALHFASSHACQRFSTFDDKLRERTRSLNCVPVVCI